jgi:hypothetical protein
MTELPTRHHNLPHQPAVPARRSALAASLALILLLSLPVSAAAEELWSELGFFVEMPAGFELEDGDGKTRFAFVDPAGGMEFDILVYESGRFADLRALAEESLRKLGSSGESESFFYEGRPSVLAEFSFPSGGARKGYGLFIEDARSAANGGRSQGPRCYALLAHTEASSLAAYADLIFSCLDSFSIDRAARRSPGPISQYLLAWPPERRATRQIGLAGEEIALPWSAEEAERELDGAGREFRVLKSYAQNQELWQEAWGRFYRMVYRESAARLDRLALEWSRLLPPDDPTEWARRLLAWVQLFVYERDTEGIDFVPPLASAYEARGDCDARAVVMAALLERLGVDCLLMVSREYSHAMLGVDVPGGGQRFPWGGKQWLVAETTAKVGIGMIAADQRDWKKWLGVELGD